VACDAFPADIQRCARQRRAFRVSGIVQGVGFRWWCAGTAKPMGLSGYAENLDDGRVKVIAQGTRASCERLLDALNSGDTAGHVDFVDATFSEPQGAFKGFGIR